MWLKDWEHPHETIAVDACLEAGWRICGESVFHIPFTEEILNAKYHISRLEILIITVALKIWANRLTALKACFWCNNKASVQVVNTGATKTHSHRNA